MLKKIQLIEKEVPNADAVVKLNDELDRKYHCITGISFPLHIGENCLLLSSSIEGNELFPKNFEVVNMQSSTSVAPDERYLSVTEEANGGKIELEFKDGGNADDYPYLLKVQIRLENDEEE